MKNAVVRSFWVEVDCRFTAGRDKKRNEAKRDAPFEKSRKREIRYTTAAEPR